MKFMKKGNLKKPCPMTRNYRRQQPDLTRFVTDLETTERLFPLIPDGVVKARAESLSRKTLELSVGGADAVLCGEALMRSNDQRVSCMK